MIEWVAQADPLREVSTVKKIMNDRECSKENNTQL